METEDLVTCFPFMFENVQAEENREVRAENVPLHRWTEKGSLDINIQLNVLYLDLVKKRLKTELMLWSCEYFLKCQD